ncbi:MAG TPA: hypothetical protein VE863_08505 [Pyrinomonadaceae bacterium]|jgi:hypothetical protein|nr:hypothetical protein [Pyrinomonadaceae bacterium]
MKALIFILIILSVSASAGVAQSGRIKNPPPSPSPSPSPINHSPAPAATQTPPALPSPKAAAAQPSPSPTPSGPKFHPAAFIITGRLITHEGKSYGGNEVKYVADEIKLMWNLQRAPVKVVRVSKMTRTEAVARAKQETDSYVLYMEIDETITGITRIITIINRIDYVLLSPRTGEVVRQFTVAPNSIVNINEHGTPVPPRVEGSSSNDYDQLRRCAWEMARVLEYWF